MANAIFVNIIKILSYNNVMIKNNFAKRLKELRLEKGLTQTELAEATKLSQAGIAKWETGDRNPSLDCAVILAKFFGCSIEYLIGLED